MRRAHILIVGLIFLAVRLAFASGRDYVAQPTYHGDPGRSGRYLVPGLTWQRAGQVHMDHSFDGSVVGQIVAQPLYWHAPGSAHGLVILATEADIVYGLDAETGRTAWRTVLGAPVPIPCFRAATLIRWESRGHL
ncbi:MAG: hypothetical protein JOY71_31435 [Acetobacteraceae bacterium]|nr:hypothetical protein [Acetobacteraceae bacterium]